MKEIMLFYSPMRTKTVYCVLFVEQQTADVCHIYIILHSLYTVSIDDPVIC